MQKMLKNLKYEVDHPDDETKAIITKYDTLHKQIEENASQVENMFKVGADSEEDDESKSDEYNENSSQK